jgi:hypothetical protein
MRTYADAGSEAGDFVESMAAELLVLKKRADDLRETGATLFACGQVCCMRLKIKNGCSLKPLRILLAFALLCSNSCFLRFFFFFFFSRVLTRKELLTTLAQSVEVC